MKKLLVFLVALVVAAIGAVTTEGCSPAPKTPQPNRTLVYSDAIQAGGPGLVDVYNPPASADSSTIPISSLERPAIMVIHGGAWHIGDKSQVAGVAAEFASLGYVAFAPNYSLAPAVEWPAPLLDLQSCLRFLRTNYSELGIDPNRIGAWGGSAGGHLSTMLMLKNDPVVVGSSSTTTTSGVFTLTGIRVNAVSTGRVTCAVDAFGPADLTIPNGMAPDEDGILTDFLGAPFAQLSQSRLLSASTTSYVRDDASVLILHGTADTMVSIDNSEHLYTALLGAQADVNFIRVYGGGHDASTYHSPEAWSTTLRFLSQRIGSQSH
ncbi:MAG TPA: alpha/beta hydrolase [Planctomycetota bacterium]|nr:alpha/beta hydrolase [Planctomycetota bacterium]